MPWYDTPPKPSRQYAIRPRRCRQRLAQRLGAGMDACAAAAVERLLPSEVEGLLGDAGFQALVAHYRGFAARPRAERVRHLADLALELLQQALAAGDVRAAIFFRVEHAAGRDPSLTLAERVACRLERAPCAPVPPARVVPPRSPAAPPRREADYGWCAATQPDEDAAAALAEGEAAKAGARLAAKTASLADAVTAEAERRATAEVDPAVAGAARFARAAHAEPLRGLNAARQLQARRDAYAEGRPPPKSPHPVPLPRSRERGQEERSDPGGAPHDASDTLSRAREREGVRGSSDPPEPPAPPPLPPWLDRVDARVRQTALALPPHEVGPYLRRIGRFYGFDTG
jgi:hypothetical protein